MAVGYVLINGSGPLPLSAKFPAPSNDEIFFVVAGSAWTSYQNTTIGFQVLLDGEPIGQAQIFSNVANSHQAVVPQYIPYTFNAMGDHTIELVALPGTTTDQNDILTVMLLV